MGNFPGYTEFFVWLLARWGVPAKEVRDEHA
jgi:hypothetical protein